MRSPLRGTRKGILIALIILSVFVFLLFAIILSYQTAIETKIMSPLVSPLVKYSLYFVVSVGALGIAVGASVFYFMSQKVESTQVVAKKSAEVLVRFLSKDEQAIVKKLVAAHGSCLQAELTRLPGLNKVKVHRMLLRLAEKQIVVRSQYGKTNTVTLAPEIYEAFT